MEELKISTSGLVNLPRLESRDDYHKWKTLTKASVSIWGGSDVVGKWKTRLDCPQHLRAAWDLKQEKLLQVLQSTFSTSVELLMRDSKTVAAVFARAALEYEDHGLASLQKTFQDFMDSTADQFDTARLFGQKLLEIQENLIKVGAEHKIPESMLVLKFINGLQASFDPWKSSFWAISTTKSDIPRFEEVLRSVEAEEARLGATTSAMAASKHRLEADEDSVMVKVKKCTNCGKKRHTKDECWKLYPELKAKQDRKRKNKTNKDQDGEGSAEEINTAHAAIPAIGSIRFDTNTSQILSGEDTVCFMAHPFGPSSKSTPATESCAIIRQWLLDSGCGNHAGHRKEDFEDLQPCSGHINGIGGSVVPIKGKGKVRLLCRTENGSVAQMVLNNVYWAPELGISLISVTQLLRKGADMKIGLDRWTIEKDNKKFVAKRYGNLFVLDTASTPVQALVSYSISPKWRLWHERMAHLSEHNLIRLKDMVEGMNEAQEYCACEACVRGRMRHMPHKGKLPKGEYAGDVVHADVCGPFHIPGYKGERY